MSGGAKYEMERRRRRDDGTFFIIWVLELKGDDALRRAPAAGAAIKRVEIYLSHHSEGEFLEEIDI
jgi:hypothetical protein